VDDKAIRDKVGMNLREEMQKLMADTNSTINASTADRTTAGKKRDAACALDQPAWEETPRDDSKRQNCSIDNSLEPSLPLSTLGIYDAFFTWDGWNATSS